MSLVCVLNRGRTWVSNHRPRPLTLKKTMGMVPAPSIVIKSTPLARHFCLFAWLLVVLFGWFLMV